MFPSSAYFIEYYQPLCGLFLGALMLVFTIVINYGNTNVRTTNWIARVILKNNSKSAYLTKELIKGIGTYFTLVGMMLIILAIDFLQNIK